MMRPHKAIQSLDNHQEQLDHDGVMVGVSRQALQEVLDYIGWIEDQLPLPCEMPG